MKESQQSQTCSETTLSSETTSSQGSKSGWITFPFILGTMAGLTLTSFGVTSNLLVFLIEKFNVKGIKATQIFNIINGCVSLLPIGGAILSDSSFGCFSVVSTTSFISLLGTILLTLTASLPVMRSPPCGSGVGTCQDPPKAHFMLLYLGIALVVIGVGGTRFNIGAMGANQFHKAHHRDSFFNWYFFTMYAAAAVATTGIVYLQDNVGWGLGFGLCAALNGISLVLFLLGSRYYKKVVPQGSPFIGLARVVVAAITKRNLHVSTKKEDYYYGGDAANRMDFSAPTQNFSFLNQAALKSEDTQPSSPVAQSWRLCTVQEVEDLKALVRVIPIWSSTIFISTLIGVLLSLIILQALTMDRHLGPHFKVPASSFQVFPLLASTIAIPLLDRVLFPAWHKLIGRYPTPLSRIAMGHLFNILGLIIAALVESKRLHSVRSHSLQDQPSSEVPMSAMWLVLPLILVGIGEPFHFPGAVALYYQEFPASLRSTAMAMAALVMGIGFYLSTAVVGMITRATDWLPNNTNKARIDNVYWLLSVIGVVNFGYFFACAWLYKHQSTGKDFKSDNP